MSSATTIVVRIASRATLHVRDIRTADISDDLARLQRLAELRSPNLQREAVDLGAKAGLPAIWEQLGHVRESHGPVRTALIGATTFGAAGVAGAVSFAAKSIYRVPRPALAEMAPPGSSFPSSHAAVVGAATGVLRRADPAHRAAYDAFERRALLAREVLGVHTRRDTQAGASLGAVLAKPFGKVASLLAPRP
jgi:membrane-associated phospholipid phosphatase